MTEDFVGFIQRYGMFVTAEELAAYGAAELAEALPIGNAHRVGLMSILRKGACMRVIPAIDLKDGRCVRLRQGDMAAETVYSEDVPAVADDGNSRAPISFMSSI